MQLHPQLTVIIWHCMIAIQRWTQNTAMLPRASVSDEVSDLQSCEWSPNNFQASSTTLAYRL